MNGPVVSPSPAIVAANAAINAAINGGGSGGAGSSQNEINAVRIGAVAERLREFPYPPSQIDEAKAFFKLCLSLASKLDMMVADALRFSEDSQGGESPHVQRGIDYAVANNEVPKEAAKLPPVLKQVCRRKHEFFLQAAIMVLMISVKNACKMGWWSAEDTEELQALANEVGSKFGTMGDLNSEATSFLPTVSSIMSRFYPQLKLGHIIASLEVKPGYGTYAVDFHIPKNVSYSSDEKIRLFVAMKDNMDTSSCIVSPQQVNLLLNGKAVERRTNVLMDPGPQLPTVVSQLLKYGTNLLQAVGQFNGHYIIVIAFMKSIPTSTLPFPKDYVQHDTAALSSGPDSEIIEGPSRISLNCPISYRRIRTPVKGHLCKHYQCFDLSNYVEINAKRPSWRCPHCNQSVSFTDLRVDQNMVTVLREAGEDVSEVIISADGKWTAASSNSRKDESQAKNLANQQERSGPQETAVNGQQSDGSCKVYDLTEEDDEMDLDRCAPVDMKPVIHHTVQGQPIHTNSTPLPAPRCTNEINQYSSTQVANGLSTRTSLFDYGTAGYMRSEAQNVGCSSGARTGNFGISPVLTDAVSPALSRQPDNFQGVNYPTSAALGQFTASNSLQQSQDALHLQSNVHNVGRGQLIPRNVIRTSSAIQALAVPMSSPNPQQHSRPAVGMPTTNGSSVAFQMPLQSNAHVGSPVGSNLERQRHFQQSFINPVNVPNMALTSVQNRPPSQVTGHSTPSHNFNRMPQTLSQPPHLMRSSRSHIQQGVSPGGVGNTSSTVQRVHLMPQQSLQIRQQQTMSQPVLMRPQTAAQQHAQMRPQPAQMRQQQVTSQQPAQMRQLQSTPLQTQPVRMTSSLPLNTVGVPQAVSRTENLIDLQAEQNWRPSGRMRGSLSGQAYSAALSQLMSQATQPALTPNPRPPVSSGTPLSPQIHVLLANRLNARGPQVQNRPTDPGTVTRPAGTQPEQP